MAKALGDELSKSQEYVSFLNAQKKYMDDEDAKTLIGSFKRKQKVLEFTESNNNLADAERLRREINELFCEIEKNDVIQKLNASLDDLLILKQSVHESIEAGAYIDDEILSLNKKCGGCKGKCGGCK